MTGCRVLCVTDAFFIPAGKGRAESCTMFRAKEIFPDLIY